MVHIVRWSCETLSLDVKSLGRKHTHSSTPMRACTCDVCRPPRKKRKRTLSGDEIYLGGDTPASAPSPSRRAVAAAEAAASAAAVAVTAAEDRVVSPPTAGTTPGGGSNLRGWCKAVVSCEHPDRPHYGKGYCRQCYMVRLRSDPCGTQEVPASV